MKTSPRNEAGWRREADLLSHELIGLIGYPQVANFIAASRSARTLGDHVELQKQLANANLEARDLDRQIGEAKERLREELGAKKTAGDQDRVNVIGTMLRDHELTLAANKRRRYALRVVQDGIIWRLFGYDRHRIAILGDGVPINYPSDAFASEAAAAEEHWSEGRLAVFCDLSNIARTGDLLVFDPPLVTVTEVKESGSADDDSPQMQRARVKVEYLNTGRSDVLAPNAPLIATGSRDAPVLRTNISVLVDLSDKARRQGWAASRAGEGAAVVMLDMRGVPDSEDAVDRARRYERRFIEGVGRRWRDPPTYEWNSSDRVLRDARNAVAATAPFSILPLDPEDCAALALGFASYRTVLNLRLLAGAVARLGLRVRPGQPSADGVAFLWIEGDRAKIRVPLHLAEQLLAELLTFSAFTEAIRVVYDHVATAKETELNVGISWRDEARVWR